MWDINFRQALTQVRQSMPFLMFRVAAYFGITLALVVASWIGAALGWIFGAFGGPEAQAVSSVWGGILGFGLACGAVVYLRDYLLFLVNAPHVALMTDLAENRSVPNDFKQVEHGWAVVQDRFGTAQSLFGLDVLVKKVIGAVPTLIDNPQSLIFLKRIDRIPAVVPMMLRLASGLNDEIILARLIRDETRNPFQDAQGVLALYARNAAPVLRAAVGLTAISGAVTCAMFVVMLMPAAFVVWIVPGTWFLGHIVFAAAFAWAFKAALIDPLVFACLMQIFLRQTAGQVPDPIWLEKLDGATTSFKTLGQRAMMWARGRAARIARWEEKA